MRAPLVVGGALLAVAVASAPALAAPPASSHASGASLSHRNVKVCSAPVAGEAGCDAVRHDTVTADGKPAPGATAAPSGYGPADLQSAYGLPVTTSSAPAHPGTGQTIAIVDAYDDPSAESDLGVYRAQYGLGACTTANGCFTKLNQNGVKGSYPRANGSWAQEISLDLDMASAICPDCKIMLVEASSASMANLGTAVNTAVNKGAAVVSNSYGGPEYSGEINDEAKYYNHTKAIITVSSGDSGYGVEFPAASRYVTAVGGTALTRDSSTRGFSETAWSGAGSGCSAYVSKPSWQTDGGCAKRTVADVSAVADPNTGVAVYDSYAYQGYKGWMVFGGTSVAAPVVGAVYARAGHATTLGATYAQSLYTSGASLNDVTSGSNGSCGGTYLCTGVAGYDGPTGLGTPNGTGAF